jgi:hypothetical protein
VQQSVGRWHAGVLRSPHEFMWTGHSALASVTGHHALQNDGREICKSICFAKQLKRCPITSAPPEEMSEPMMCTLAYTSVMVNC